MKLGELRKSIIDGGYYMEDTGILSVGLATIIANRLKIGGRPVWMTIVGPSSSGKSQILEPLIMTGKGEMNEKGERQPGFIYNVDDLTANTLISGSGKDQVNSLLNKDFTFGMLAMTDLTVLISKDPKERDQIMSQFRKVYDGGFTKGTGNQKGFLEWEGYIGFISGSTPSIYHFMEDVGDMGERFVSYRMRNLNDDAITNTAMFRTFDGKELNKKMAQHFDIYIKKIVSFYQGDSIPGDSKKGAHQLDVTDIGKDNIKEIIKIARFAEKLRTVTKHDFHGHVERIPIQAGSTRTAKQLLAYAQTFSIMKKAEGKEFGQDDMDILEWIGWSLANEEKRAILEFIAKSDKAPKESEIAVEVGIHHTVVSRILSNLMALKVLKLAETQTDFDQYTFYDRETEMRVKKLVDYQFEEEVEGEDIPI